MIRFTLTLKGVAQAQAALGRIVNGIRIGVSALTLAAALDTRLHLAESTPKGATGAARAGWQSGPGWQGLHGPGGVAGARVWNDVPHIKFLIEGTGRRRVDGVLNPHWAGMSPNALLRSAWLNAPRRVADFMLAHAADYFAA